MGRFVVDLVTRGESGEPWRMVLVEEGPWPDAQVNEHMRRLQDRLYDCVDAAIEGGLASQFPESAGAAVIVRLDGYQLPDDIVRDFFERFSSTVLQDPGYAKAVADSTAVESIGFELNLDGHDG